MTTVFILEHLHIHEDGEECWKRIGIYTSYEKALSAMDRVKSQPGFSDFPELTDYDSSDTSGFRINNYELNKDHWQEGYVTVY